MTKANRWLLPDGVDEILPPQANNLEMLRRNILDLYRSWGYELVNTPLIEFLDSLMIVPNDELQLETFKVIDQLSGRTMGVRADITSQVARIDAHVLQSDAPSRLCYADNILRTKPSSKLGSRSPVRIGAELYGHKGNASDIEVISLMLETLSATGINDVQLALGHVSIYRALIDAAQLESEIEKKLFSALQSKSDTEINNILEGSNINTELLSMLKALPHLSGASTVLDKAETLLANAPAEALQAIQQLREISAELAARYPQQSFYYDLCELRGYQYHTGIVFAAYTPEFGQSIAKGGRYDDIGAGFGRARAATGFDADLKTLLSISKLTFKEDEKIFAPAQQNEALSSLIIQLRQQGKRVICALEGQQESAQDMNCDSQIIQINGQWQVQSL